MFKAVNANSLFVAGLLGIVLAAGCVQPSGDGTDTNENGDDVIDNSSGIITGSEARVYGRVFDASTDLGLPGVSISADGVTGSTDTDADGRFALDLPQGGTYAMSARLDGYTYAQRRAIVDDAELAAVPDMYLTPVDPAAIRIGSEGGTGANSDGSIELDVPPGALPEEEELHATWYEEGKDLPNFLPELSHFTYACDLTPDGLTFDEPVAVRLRNDRGFAPGTPIPIGLYDPETLEWDHESMGVVSTDGAWVEFEVTHFSPRDCNLGRSAPAGSGQPGDAEDTTGDPRTERNNQGCGSVRAGSRVDVEDGHLLIEHLLPSYRSLGRARTVALQYNSPLAESGVVLQVRYDISQTRTAVPDRMRFVAEVAGQRVERFYDPVEGPIDMVFRWDGRDGMGTAMPPGTYTYRLTLANEYRTTFAIVSEFGAPAVSDTGVAADEYMSLESSFTGVATLETREDKPAKGIAPGWGIVGLHTLREREQQVSIVGGDGSFFAFAADASGAYTPATGDFSTLVRTADGTFIWTHRDGTSLIFDAEGRHTSLADRNDNTTAFTYDSEGRLQSIVGPVGLITTFAYGDDGQLARITDPAGRVTTFEFDDAGDLAQIINPDATSRRFVYDAGHRITAQTDAGSNTTTYTYDTHGAVVRVDRPDGTHSEHSAAALAESSFTDPSGQKYRFSVNSFGTRTGVTDPLGRTTVMTRDEHDRLIKLVLPSGKSTSYEYDDVGNLTRISGFGASANSADDLQITYDPALDLPLTAVHAAAGTWRNTYDAAGNLTQTRLPGGYTYEYTYDDHGQRTSSAIAGETISYTYDDLGNLASFTDPGGGLWTFTHDTFGNLSGVTDPDGHSWTATYNTMNLIEQITNGAGETVRFEYAPARGSLDLDNLGPVAVPVSVTDGRGNTTTLGYDAMYRPIHTTDPLGHTTRFEYDSTGHLVTRIEPTGASVQFTYNEAGQLTGKSLSTGETINIEYDENTGLPISMTGPDSRLGFAYDWYELISEATTTFTETGVEAPVTYQHRTSAYGESLVQLHVGEQRIDYGYEWSPTGGWLPDSRIGGGFFWLDFTYDSAGRRSRWRESYSTIEKSYTYDAAGRLTSSTLPGSEGQSISWDYSLAGLRTSMTDLDGSHTYTYDAAGRLTGATHPTGDNPQEAYSYDPAGNRRIAGQEESFDYDAANRLLEDPQYTYSYDAAGNLTQRINKTSGATTSYTYDAENRLTRALLPDDTEVVFGYDPWGRRCMKQIGSDVTHYIYDGDEVIGEFDAGGRLRRQYITGRAIDMLDGFKTGGAASYANYFYTIDPLGTVMAVTNDQGDTVQSYRYQAFGQPVASGGSLDNSRLFAGSEYDEETGLIYMRRRYYDPVTGRFLQRDPSPVPSALAPYLYAGNNPTQNRDPYGLEPGSGHSTWGSQFQEGGMFYENVGKPTYTSLVSQGLGRVGDIPEAVSGGRLPPMPGIGAGAVAAWGQWRSWNTVIGVYGAENPPEAGISWWNSRWWNGTSHLTEGFLTMGGRLPRREAHLGPICGLREGLYQFFVLNLGL